MDNNFKFNISLSILNHLGRNLYRNFITVLGEAISNSWDADAENIWIFIDKENNCLVVKDDGEGMTDDDFQKKFLTIGYSKRKQGEIQTSKKRPFIGRKGIGKLALLSCAEKIHIITKTKEKPFVGGVIDNRGLDEAIKEDIQPQDYFLGQVDHKPFENYKNQLNHGTIIYFQNINEGIRNNIDYIRKLIALYFRFSLIDKTFKIHLNNVEVTLNDLNDLASNTQFVWQINNIEDKFLEQYISEKNVKKYQKISSELNISGFIATVEKPSNLKIRSTNEKLSIDLYVNGRLREKDLLKHIPTTRIVESYVYGQIHFNGLDGEKDIFTSSREGVVSDDTSFQELLEELKRILSQIIKDWDIFRDEINQDGDIENERLTKKERKSKELFNIVVDEYTPQKNSINRNRVDEWANSLRQDAQYNLTSYAECFVSENLLRKYIKYRRLQLTKEALISLQQYKKREDEAKNKANISFEIRENSDDLLYLSMDHLSNLADKPIDPKIQAGIARDAKVYKPIRDAVAHTSIITTIAKNSLNTTYENIKARIKKLLSN